MNFLRILSNILARLVGMGLIVFSVYYGVIHAPHGVRAGIFHIPSLLFVGLGLLGIILASYRLEIFLGMIGSTVALSPSSIRTRFLRVESLLPELAETYYEKGGAAVLAQVDDKRLGNLWRFIASKLEARMPIHDIQMFLQNHGKLQNEKLFTQIRALQGLATVAPAVGMTGTILGLIKLLKDLNQFETLGSNMALAFITALYGLIFGNFVFIPIVNRLNSGREELMNIVSQGVFWLDMISHRKPAHYLDAADTPEVSSS